MPTIKLQSSDGVTFDVDVDVARCFGTIATMLDNLGTEGEEEIIPLPKVDAKTLEKIICWATRHKDDPPASQGDSKEDNRTDEVKEWDEEFFNCDQSTLYELIMAANYLDIDVLLHLCCKTVANMIKGKTLMKSGRFLTFRTTSNLRKRGGFAGKTRGAKTNKNLLNGTFP